MTKLDLWNFLLTANAFSGKDEIDKLIIESYHNKEQFGEVKDCKNGFLAPNGIFFPCNYAAHENLREYLQRIFKMVEFGKHTPASTLKFESEFVKFNGPNDYEYKNELMYQGEVMTPYQKLFIHQWAKEHDLKNHYYFKKNGNCFPINWCFIINEKLQVTKNKE